MSLDV
jgi:hypothetical protein